MKILDVLRDKRSECFSVMTSMTLSEYKEIASCSFEKGGNIDGQRDVIRKSAVASKIRKRMHDDFISGAVFPPVVLGLLVDTDMFSESTYDEDVAKVISSTKKDNISIIDGMQRSNVYFTNFERCKDQVIRVEFWIAQKSIRLLYRMLVLNTGQVPWNTRRQVEVVFKNIATSITELILHAHPEWKDKITLMGVDDKQRRTQAGKYQQSTVIEMYMGFNTRNSKVDVSEELANEFQRFDMMEAIDKEENFRLFVRVLQCLISLDFAFSECKEIVDNGQFKEGKDIFSSVPACLGFVVSCAEYILGKNPVERTTEQKQEKCKKLEERVQDIIQFISEKETPLALAMLNEILEGLSKARIGDEMRRTFKNAFSEMIKYDNLNELPSFESFWRE